MGNCHACLSSKHCNNYSSGDHHHHHAEDPDLLEFGDVLSEPLLHTGKELHDLNNILQGGVDQFPSPAAAAAEEEKHILAAAAAAAAEEEKQHLLAKEKHLLAIKEEKQHLLAPAAAAAAKENHDLIKPIKKVRFSNEVMLISTSDQQQQEIEPLAGSSHEREGEELFHKKKKKQQLQHSGMLMNPSPIDQSRRSNGDIKEGSNNMVRVKVVISKKDLTELLNISPNSRDQNLGASEHALMERILAPLGLSAPPQSSINTHQRIINPIDSPA